MKTYPLALVLVNFLLASADIASDRNQWLQFKAQHNKLYSNHVEETKRFSIFQSNLRKIEKHNAKFDNGETTYYLGVTPFADLSQEEFSVWLNRPNDGNNTINVKHIDIFEAPSDASVPSSFDWRQKNAVTAVKSQDDCGGCWSFAATGTLEGAYAIKHKKLVSFSEQFLIDCGKVYGEGMFGCNGGWENLALNFVAEYGIESETDYPFQGRDGSCHYDKSRVVSQSKVKGYVAVKNNDANALKVAVATQGPCTVAIMADYIYLYAGGIYNDDKCTKTLKSLNHAMLAVGYGTQNGVDYWIVKNSWGAEFGEGGYIKIKRGVNQCGVEVRPYYATY